MDQSTALAALAALSHETRLSVFRLLVTAGPHGMAAGSIAGKLDVLPNTLSAHLAQLDRAGLIVANRDGRSIRYGADYAGMRDLMAFLMRDCCGGNAEICAPLVAIAAECDACCDEAMTQ